MTKLMSYKKRPGLTQGGVYLYLKIYLTSTSTHHTISLHTYNEGDQRTRIMQNAIVKLSLRG